MAIGDSLIPYKDTFIIDARNMFVMPGGVDPCTHFDCELMGARTAEDFYTGTRAAVAGGTTTIIDYIMPYRGEALIDAYQRTRDAGDTMAVCDYALHMCITWTNQDIIDEMQVMANRGINSFKMYMGLANYLMIPDDVLYSLFIQCRRLGALPMVHAENGNIVEENAKLLFDNDIDGLEGHYRARTVESEGEAIFRACVIARLVQCPLYICNVMSTHGVENIVERRTFAKAPIFGEVITAALALQTVPTDLTLLRRYAFTRSPPIRRDKENSVKLMQYLSNGTLTLTASDDCSFQLADKVVLPEDFQNIPCGTNGVEDRMSIIWDKGVNTGMISPCEFVAVTSTNAAKIFNLYPKKGLIAEGADADLVIWNPNKSRKISVHQQKQACDYNVYHNLVIKGGPEVVIVKGKICLLYDELNVQKGFGKFLKTECFCDYVYKAKKD